MKKNIEQALPELMEAGIITEDTARRIRDFYAREDSGSVNWLYIIFGILGALLVGLGLILIVAHNWDNLPRLAKVGLAFVPLLLGQAVGAYVVLKRLDQTAWRESVATFLVFALGGCMALITQIYNIPGELRDFLLGWSLLSWPLIFVMRSSMASLLYLLGITWFVSEAGYGYYRTGQAYYYWGLLLLAVPYYYQLYRNNPQSNFTAYHHWLIPISISIALGSLSESDGNWLVLAYLSLFNVFFLLSRSPLMQGQRGLYNGYSIIGGAGIAVLLMTLSFHWFWEGLQDKDPMLSRGLATPELLVSLFLMAVSGLICWWNNRGKALADINPLDALFVLCGFLFLVGTQSDVLATLLTNLLLLGVGVSLIRQGARQNHLGYLNAGLLLVSVQIACRFFDIDLSFALRGLLFVALGVAFFAVNYRMIQKRKAQ